MKKRQLGTVLIRSFSILIVQEVESVKHVPRKRGTPYHSLTQNTISYGQNKLFTYVYSPTRQKPKTK